MHEISHNLAFKGTPAPRYSHADPLLPSAASSRLTSPPGRLPGMFANRVLSIIANLPLGIPAAISFRKSHLEHHRYQGHDVVDVDVPCEWEGWFFVSAPRKFLW